jgi:hypothetical protein
MSDVIALYASSAVEPDWQFAEELISEVDGDMLDRLQSATWGTIADDLIVEAPAGRRTFLGARAAQAVLREDLQALRDALDGPPEGLVTISFAGGAVVHYFDERVDSRLRDALDRLRDFDVLRAAGLTPGSW